MKFYRLISVIFFIGLTACSTNKDTNQNNEQLHIYTSIYPIQYIVEQIAGEEAIVESVYPPGVDAHTYEPSSREITQLANGDAFIFLGAGMEGFSGTIADTLASHDILFIELGDFPDLFSADNPADADGHDDHGHHDKDVDPHIWLDPLRMIDMGKIISASLAEIAPDSEERFQRNFSQFEKEMQTLDQKFIDVLADKKNKKIIVTHAAYGYWEKRYGIEQIAISGLSSSDEPSQKDLTEVAKLAKDHQIHDVIFEKNSSNRLASIIQEHINADRLYIHNLEVLTEEDIEQNEDYISLMHANLKVLDDATN